MTDIQTFYIALAVTALVSALIIFIIQQLRYQKRLNELQQQNTELTTTLELERRNHAEKLQALDAARQQLSETFSALSSQALKENNDVFLKLAQENLQKFQSQAQGELTQKEKAIESLLKPIQKALEKTEQQIQNIEKDRIQAYTALHQNIENMTHTQNALRDETQNLVKALRRPEVRGQWGELTLKRLAELAGMVEHCDFYEQQEVKTDEGKLRPDMIIRLPGGREIVVDVKTPLDAYLQAVETHDESLQKEALIKHARNVRQRVNELASKAYWGQFKNAPDFVVLFIPGDQFLSSALDQDHKLLEDALAQQVILATPTSLVALLRAVAYGWRQEQLAKNAEHIQAIGADLYQRLATFAGHLNKMGKSLDSSLKHYNSAVGSFDSRILPSVDKFRELGIPANKNIDKPEQIETGIRSIVIETDKET